MSAAHIALAALLPMIVGPLPTAGTSVTALLCGPDGVTRTITIDLPRKDDAPAEPCRTKGCHAGNCRKRFDPAQGRPSPADA
ncbi:hypothetical protein [Qipengyuania flava]|uniref:hypothetical protein n=1 Tax=Qipengyuania flava TaxID=192812 RepID=UPI001C635A7A|nr:hypothetical protein [Qipengyuania flava]QYJ07809.1 hypothetical protein KUV82_03600 [Qipengyuania flava]